MGGRTQDGAVKGVRSGERDIALGRRVFLVGLLILRCPFWTGCTPTVGGMLLMLLMAALWMWLWDVGCKFCAPTFCDWEILGCDDDDEVGVLWRVMVVEDVVDRGEDVDEGNVGNDDGGDKVEGVFLRMCSSCP